MNKKVITFLLATTILYGCSRAAIDLPQPQTKEEQEREDKIERDFAKNIALKKELDELNEKIEREKPFLRKAHEIQKQALRELYFGSQEKAKKLLTAIAPKCFLPLKSLEIFERDCIFYVRFNGNLENPTKLTFGVLSLLEPELDGSLTTDLILLENQIEDAVKHRRSKGMCH